ncbi:RluA family pseudouridine synthase [Peptostreptococcus equinus]|uniref:Pseudouridine synthase n=1 Tax=Peptostreptococcus equinus TaxID=3003601 RepID=A0ABY7JSP5_9FIRM|nr:RluA family pseudouridine synthase [Peptostreptococcus sp. CBA3647]WAW15861.1 RluA family pseudouridine synthase [Peptostreptococcus sp. CBA3647]
MFKKEEQRWDKFVIHADKKIKLKDLLVDDLGFSIRAISKIKRQENLYVNSEKVRPSHIVEENDIVEIILDERQSDFMSQDLGVEVLYDDFDIMVMDKPPFMVVHPTKSHNLDTLANAASFVLNQKRQECKIRFINRLDMNTSGLVMIGKNAYAHHRLSSDMEKDLIDKRYIAIVKGRVKEDFGTIDEPIYRENEDTIKRIVDSRGQKSITHYKVIKRFDDASVLSIKLETGRTHQIRVHLSHIGHGIIGDELYGYVDENMINRQALHACQLEFNQPRTGKRINIKSDLPNDMKRLIEILEEVDDNK